MKKLNIKKQGFINRKVCKSEKFNTQLYTARQEYDLLIVVTKFEDIYQNAVLI